MTERSSFTPARTSLRRLAACGLFLLAGWTWIGCNQDAERPAVVDDEQEPGAGVVSREPDEEPRLDEPDLTDGSDPGTIGQPVPDASRPARSDEAVSEQGSSAPSDVPPSEPAAPPRQTQNGDGAKKPPASASAKSRGPAPPPDEVHKPEVILSQRHAETSPIGVGDAFPAITLPNREGQPQELSQLYGDRMTVVVFWNARNLYAREQYSRIMQEIHDRYNGLGVSVAAINVGDSPEVVQELATRHEVTVPTLLDIDGAAFQQVATDLLPRTYLLDAEGRVLWFDLEYSRSQRQGLHNAIHYHLNQGRL